MQINKMGTRLRFAKATPLGLTLVQSKLITLRKSVHGTDALVLYLSACAGVVTSLPKMVPRMFLFDILAWSVQGRKYSLPQRLGDAQHHQQHRHFTMHSSNLRVNSSRLRFLPMNTILQHRFSPSFHGSVGLPPSCMCTAWNTYLLGLPFTASTPLDR